MSNAIHYEIEIRFLADSAEAAFRQLPFLEATLGPEKAWNTDIYGRAIYESGKLLRIGHVSATDGAHYYLGYKGADEGATANIRQEWGEEITEGTAASTILRKLDIQDSLDSPMAIITRLKQAGYLPFMGFTGVDRLGYDRRLGVETKLMRCPKILGDQVMIELEYAAHSLTVAFEAEQKLIQIAKEYHIMDQLVHAEPPTLLYQATFAD